jgi:hypoxanthine phosphoribosyltransferase
MPVSSQEALEILRRAEVVCSADVVSAAVTRLAGEINQALREANPLVLCVMRGALVFAGQLLPQLDFPLAVDTLDVTRYGDRTQGGEVQFRQLPATDVAGRTVLVVDDILDQGVTLAAIRDWLLAHGAQRVLIAVFAVKQTARRVPVSADFCGLTVPDRYVFGFGMDVHGYWRNLPVVYALTI